MLVSLRHPDSHQGNLWEFPGGKLQAGETVEDALRREFREEIGLEIARAFPLQRIAHHYADKSVLLEVWLITECAGTARGMEGQAIAWRDVADLRFEDFPAANAPIIKTLRLPRQLAITPSCANVDALRLCLDQLLEQDIGLIQLRQKQLDGSTYLDWFHQARRHCEGHPVQLIFNQEPELLPDSGADGYHATSRRLLAMEQRPQTPGLLFSASCHDRAQLQQAAVLNADFVTLSPVCATARYAPGRELGWAAFGQLASEVSLPVYALGGVGPADLELAQGHGAFGIAGISGFCRGAA